MNSSPFRTRKRVREADFWTNLPDDEAKLADIDAIQWSKEDFDRYDFTLMELMPWISPAAFAYLVSRYATLGLRGSLFTDAIWHRFHEIDPEHVNPCWSEFDAKEVQALGPWLEELSE